jgi:hypothetical protein
MKKGLGISGKSRSFLTSSQTPASSTPDDEPVPATSMVRRGLALSGAGRRLGISGMNRPGFERPAPVTTDPSDDEVLP